MYCPPLNCLFIAIPKTASQSIEAYFLANPLLAGLSQRELLLGSNPGRGPRKLNHLLAREYQQLGLVETKAFDRCFKFAFVRNPWDRLVSEYRFRDYPMRCDFKTWLMRKLPPPDGSDKYRHILPQYDFIHDEDGHQLVDFVGRFEQLNTDFKKVQQQLNLPDHGLQRTNDSSMRLAGNIIASDLESGLRIVLSRVFAARIKRNTFSHYSQYYDDESRQIVARMYARDIDTFAYQFEEKTTPCSPV